MAIALGVVMAVNVPIKETVEILAEKVDIGGRFYVSPGKLRINIKDEPVTVSVYAKNKSEGADVYSIQLMTPIGYEPGYKEWDGSYTIEFRELVRIGADRLARFDVTLTRLESGGKQEIWLVVGESEVDWLVQELAVRILVDG